MGENLIPRHPRMGTWALSQHLKFFDATASKQFRRPDSVITVHNDANNRDVSTNLDEKIEQNTNNLCECRADFTIHPDDRPETLKDVLTGNAVSSEVSSAEAKASRTKTFDQMNTSTDVSQTYLDRNVKEIQTFVDKSTDDVRLSLNKQSNVFQRLLSGHKAGLYRLWDWVKNRNDKVSTLNLDTHDECDALNYNRNAAGPSPRSDSCEVKPFVSTPPSAQLRGGWCEHKTVNCDRNDRCEPAVNHERRNMNTSDESGTSAVPGQNKCVANRSDTLTLSQNESTTVNGDNGATVSCDGVSKTKSRDTAADPQTSGVKELNPATSARIPPNNRQNKLNTNDNAIGLLLEKDAEGKLRPVFRGAEKLASTVFCGKFCLFSVLGTNSVMVLYCFFGAMMFWALERPRGTLSSLEALQDRAVRDFRAICTKRNLTPEAAEWAKEVDQVLTGFRESIEARATDPRWDDQGTSKWTWSGALLFTVTLVTTVGCGYVPITTLEARIAAIVYALLGIPLAFVSLLSVSFQITRCMGRLYQLIASRIGSRRFLTKPKLSAWICLSLVLIYLCVAAAVFSQMEDWGYPESLYFCFMLLSTVGLDSSMLGFNDKEGSTARHGACIVFLLVGLTLVATCFHVMARDCLSNVRRAAMICGYKYESEDDDDDDEFMTNADLLRFDSAAQGDTNPNRYFSRSSPTPGTSAAFLGSGTLALDFEDSQQPKCCRISNQRENKSGNRCTNQSSTSSHWRQTPPCGANCCKLAKGHPPIPSPNHQTPMGKVLKTLSPMERAALCAADEDIDWILDAEVSDSDDDQVTSSSAEDPTSVINVGSLIRSSTKAPNDTANCDHFAETSDVDVTYTGVNHYVTCESETMLSLETEKADCTTSRSGAGPQDEDEKTRGKDKDGNAPRDVSEERTQVMNNEHSQALKRLLQEHQETYLKNLLVKKRLRQLQETSKNAQATVEDNEASHRHANKEKEDSEGSKCSVNPNISLTGPSTQLSEGECAKENLQENDPHTHEDKKGRARDTKERIHSREGVFDPAMPTSMITLPSAQLRGGQCDHERDKTSPATKTKKKSKEDDAKPTFMITLPSAQLRGGQCDHERDKTSPATKTEKKSKEDGVAKKRPVRHSAGRHDSLKMHRKHFKEHSDKKPSLNSTGKTPHPNAKDHRKSDEFSDDRKESPKPAVVKRTRRSGTQPIPKDCEKQSTQRQNEDISRPPHPEVQPVANDTQKKTTPTNAEGNSMPPGSACQAALRQASTKTIKGASGDGKTSETVPQECRPQVPRKLKLVPTTSL